MNWSIDKDDYQDDYAYNPFREAQPQPVTPRPAVATTVATAQPEYTPTQQERVRLGFIKYLVGRGLLVP